MSVTYSPTTKSDTSQNNAQTNVTRRDFLKVSAIMAGTLFIADTGIGQQLASLADTAKSATINILPYNDTAPEDTAEYSPLVMPREAEAASSTFERGVAGATGWATCKLVIRKSKSTSSSKRGTLPAGKPFCINSASNGWFNITYGKTTGYVQHKYCLINLPDVIPSITYNLTYASGATDKSCGYRIPRVTGKKLYSKAKVWNKRLKRNEYMCPLLYSVAKKVWKAQQAALKDGYSLKIYDAYRPHSVTNTLSKGMAQLYNSNKTVRSGVNYSKHSNGKKYKWGKNWFVAASVSTHNTGSAIDVTLINKTTGKELSMPTAMNECSTKAIKYYSPSASHKASNYSKGMKASAAAKRLDRYMTNAGMSTLASEWWHFQDNSAHKRIKGVAQSGCNFQVTRIVSK